MILLAELNNFKLVLQDPSFQSLFAGTTLGIIIGFLIIIGIILAFILLLGLYIYMAMAFMTIAKKLDYDEPWLAWIPFANLFLLPILAKKHWAWGFLFLIPPVYFIAAIVWLWEIFELRNYAGAFSLILLLALIPPLGIFALTGFLIIIGFVAWKDVGSTKRNSVRSKPKNSRKRGKRKR